MLQKIESVAEHRKWEKEQFFWRGNAIFYAFCDAASDTRICFFNHYLHKRGIAKVLCKMTIRDADGGFVARHFEPLSELRVHAFSTRELTGQAHFEGSVDCEFISAENIFVPYSAVVAAYVSRDSLCQLHAYTRKLNREEIEDGLCYPQAAEAGWSLRDTARVQSIGVFHVGDAPLETPLTLELSNTRGERRTLRVAPRLYPANSLIRIVPADIAADNGFDLIGFLGGAEGHASVMFVNAPDMFPRGIVGNRVLDAGAIADFQATHSNFDYTRFALDSLAPGESGYTLIPETGAGRDAKLITYPSFACEKLEIRNGDTRQTAERQTVNVLAVAPNSIVQTSPAGGALPNRVVNAIVLGNPGRLPAECSTGISTSQYRGIAKHYYWGYCGGAGSRAVITVSPTCPCDDFTGVDIEITIFGETGELGSRKYNGLSGHIVSFDLAAIPLQADTGERFFVLKSSYPWLSVFNVMEDTASGAACIEHAF